MGAVTDPIAYRGGEAIASANRIVLKIGSALLIDPATQAVDASRLSQLVAMVADWKARGKKVLVVSSGAVALGYRRLGHAGPAELEVKQAAAAVGQSMLMAAWSEAFAPHGVTTAQILLTRDDTETRRRWLNARATAAVLLDLGVVPVVNENDTVATEEIRYGDNDRLAARAAQLIGADLLILLSDVDGLYSADPRRDPEADHIDFVAALTPEIEAMAGGTNLQTGVGSGGMATKLMAARIAGAAGCATLIASGLDDAHDARRLEDGRRCTLIAAPTTVKAAYKQWIGGALSTRGRLVVDAGCAKALRQGKSLLAVGLTAVEGAFGKGDPVAVIDRAGLEIARGLARYDSDDMIRIMGLQSEAVKRALGYDGAPIAVHADDLSLRS